jgi:hypothetical protein
MVHTHTTPSISTPKKQAYGTIIIQRKPSDPEFIPRAANGPKNTMRDEWKPDDWYVGAPEGSDAPQIASQPPQLGECEDWLLYQQFFQITPYNHPLKNVFLSSFDIYQWLKLCHIDGFISPYALHKINIAFSKAGGHVLTHMRPMGRGVYTIINNEVCVIVFAGYYILCGDISIQAWMLAHPGQSLALSCPWTLGSINVGKSLMESKHCKMFEAVPLRKTAFACLLDSSITNRLIKPKLDAIDVGQLQIIDAKMSEDYVQVVTAAIPDEVKHHCLAEIRRRDAESVHSTPEALQLAERDRETRYPRDDQDTVLVKLSATAFLWAPNVKIDGQRWKHHWDPTDFAEDETMFRSVIEADRRIKDNETKQAQPTETILIESSPSTPSSPKSDDSTQSELSPPPKAKSIAPAPAMPNTSTTLPGLPKLPMSKTITSPQAITTPLKPMPPSATKVTSDGRRAGKTADTAANLQKAYAQLQTARELLQKQYDRTIDRNLLAHLLIDQVLKEENEFIDEVKRQLTNMCNGLNHIQAYNRMVVESNNENLIKDCKLADQTIKTMHLSSDYEATAHRLLANNPYKSEALQSMPPSDQDNDAPRFQHFDTETTKQTEDRVRSGLQGISQGITRPLIAKAEDIIRQPFDFTKRLSRKATQREVTIGAIERERARQEEAIKKWKEADDKAYAKEVQCQLLEEDLANLAESDSDAPPHISPTTVMLRK